MPPDRNALQPRAKPWIVAIGVEPGSPLASMLESTGGTANYQDGLARVRITDYEFVVAVGWAGQLLPNHVNVVHFDPTEGGPDSFVREYSGIPGRVISAAGHRAAEFEVDPAADATGLGPLIRETVMATIPVEDNYRVYKYVDDDATDKFEGLVSERGGHPLAAVAHSPAGAEWWYLPLFVVAKERLVREIFARWRTMHPEKFGTPADIESGVWRTNAEMKAARDISNFERETESYLKERKAALAQLEATAEAVSLQADRHEKVLLTGTGPDLEDAVASALTTLGFAVVNSDERQAAKGSAKREDLEVKSAAHAGWVALAEIKGYENRSAKTSDITQLQKAAAFYERDHDKKPDSLWYIINANHGKLPDARSIPLASSPDDVEIFAEDGGAVIDTRELFRMVRAVQAGTLSTSDAVAALVSARGIFSSHPEEDRSIE